MNRFVRYEGGHICITGDMKAAIDWYCKHMGLTLAWHSVAERMCVMLTPGKIAGISLKGAREAGSREPNVRLVFETPDIERTHAQLAEEGVRITAISKGPGGTPYFDFYDLESNRLTAVANPALTGSHPDARFVRYGNSRIGVSNLGSAVAWYERHLGMQQRLVDESGKNALMDMGNDIPIWLETLPTEAFTGEQPASVRPFFLTLDIEEAHRYCEEHGLRPTEIQGTPNALQLFHAYDPDGNWVNIWTYPYAEEQYKAQQEGKQVGPRAD